MPVRSLHSSVLKWPDKSAVMAALKRCVGDLASRSPDLLRVGCYGSYARGDWGVGSDLDLVFIVTDAARPYLDRPLDWDLSMLPVPVDLRVYTAEEWADVVARGDRFAHIMQTEVDWVLDRPAPDLEEQP